MPAETTNPTNIERLQGELLDGSLANRLVESCTPGATDGDARIRRLLSRRCIASTSTKSRMPKLRRLTIQGFRSFGSTPQVLEFESEIAAVWGPNSQGKTSLAEAAEFLFTGSTVRREMTASAQDEFADALRNAHLPEGTDVFVEAELDVSGTLHTLRRTLVADYAKKQNCQSRLEVDGSPADESQLASLGIILSEPPLAAPILMQHTLGYLFSARPKERSQYFKALLEVSDLDAVSTKIQIAIDEFDQAEPLAAGLERCIAAAPSLGTALKPLLGKWNTLPSVGEAMNVAAGSLLTEADTEVPDLLDERLVAIRQVLDTRRARTFPIEGLAAPAGHTWASLAATTWESLTEFRAQCEKVADETQRLVALFDQALKVPAIAGATEAVDCPLCETPASLTPERVKFLQSTLEESDVYQQARSKADGSIRQISTALKTLDQTVKAGQPGHAKWSAEEKEEKGFSVTRMETLLGETATESIAAWQTADAAYVTARQNLLSRAEKLSPIVQGYVSDPTSLKEVNEFKAAIEELTALSGKLTEARNQYVAARTPLHTQLTALADQQSATAGWQDFLDVAADRQELGDALCRHQARQKTLADCRRALKQIDKAKAAVFNQRFQELSSGIADWWEMLRRDEPSYFDQVSLRKGGKRNIDFKAGLVPATDRKQAKIRDVISVFSYSQLHCLGLAAFLARAEREQPGFIILDDPVQSSDEDHRAPFTHEVVKELAKRGLQVIVLTQTHGMWQDVHYTYGHQNADIFQISLAEPTTGTQVVKTSDDLQVMLSRVEPYVKSKSPDILKDAAIKLRDAAERFCKELLVKDRRASGDTTAAISDYANKNLKELRPSVEPLFTDADHAGRFRACVRWLNKGDHGTTPPNAGDIKTAYDYLKQLKRKYL